MSAFWDIVADAVSDKVEHDPWCWRVAWAETARAAGLGFRCDCRHAVVLAAIRRGPLA